MKIRKMKKVAKKSDDKAFRHITLYSLKLIKQWCKIDHPNSKSNMKILTENFYHRGKFI